VSLALALRLVLRGDRAGRVRLLLMTTGVALGVALLLGVAGVLPAAETRWDVQTGRNQSYDEIPRTEGVTAMTSTGFWRARELHALRFVVTGPPVAPPPGLPRLPEAGEAYVSPALAEAMRGPYGPELVARVPGRVVGTIGKAGLIGPDELYFVAPAAPGTLDRSTLAAGFDAPGSVDYGGTTATEELRIVVPLAGIALVVPILVLIATSTRLSAASRERRAAAMRLVGATARQVARLTAVEGAVVGAAGAVLGVMLFGLLRVPVAGVLPVADGVHASSIAPGPGAAALVLLGVPLLAVVSGLLSLRRVITSPLGVSRQSRTPGAGPLRLVPLVVGCGLLGLAYLDRASLVTNAGRVGAVLLAGAALTLLGLAVAGPALARLGGLVLHRWGPGPASQLAGRRLILDPSAAARTVTGTALVVAVGGWALAFIPVLAQAQNGYLAGTVALLKPGTVLAGLTDTGARLDLGGMRGLPGVQAVMEVQTVRLLREGQPVPTDGGAYDPATEPVIAVIADCNELSAVLREPLRGCRADQVQRIETSSSGGTVSGGPSEGQALPSGRLRLLSGSGTTLAGGAIAVPRAISGVQVPVELSSLSVQLFGTYLVPPSLVRATGPAGLDPDSRSLLVATDGSADAIESVRSAMAVTSMQAPPLTPAETLGEANRTTDAYRTAALVGLVVVVLVGGMTMAVSTADGLRERLRPHAALVALGAPLALLRRSVLLQVATPLLLSVALAVLASAVASGVYLQLNNVGQGSQPVLPLPWLGYGIISAAAVLATLLATAASLPLLRAASRPGALRSE